MRGVPALALVAAALVLAGCSRGGETADASAPEKRQHSTSSSPKRDVAWIVLLRQWRVKLARRSERAIPLADQVEKGTREPGDLERRLQPLTECRATLDEEVGEPNAARYRRSYELFKSVCDSVSDWARALEDSAAPAELDAKEETIATRFDEADMQLETSLMALKPLPTIGAATSRSRIEPRFSRALSKLAYTRSDAATIEVRCWSKRDWPVVKLEWGAMSGTIDFAGFAYDSYRVSIAPEYCDALARLVYKHERPTEGRALAMTAASVGLLAHEGTHLARDESEARTECFAVQRVRDLAVILGTSRSYADGLAEVNWKYIYPSEPREYRTSACRNDGPLDIHRNSDVWP